MSEPLPTEEEWKAWLTQPSTLMFRKYVLSAREQLKEAMADGEFVEETPQGTATKYIAAVAQCKAFSMLSELNYEQVTSEIDDGKL